MFKLYFQHPQYQQHALLAQGPRLPEIEGRVNTFATAQFPPFASFLPSMNVFPPFMNGFPPPIEFPPAANMNRLPPFANFNPNMIEANVNPNTNENMNRLPPSTPLQDDVAASNSPSHRLNPAPIKRSINGKRVLNWKPETVQKLLEMHEKKMNPYEIADELNSHITGRDVYKYLRHLKVGGYLKVDHDPVKAFQINRKRGFYFYWDKDSTIKLLNAIDKQMNSKLNYTNVLREVDNPELTEKIIQSHLYNLMKKGQPLEEAKQYRIPRGFTKSLMEIFLRSSNNGKTH